MRAHFREWTLAWVRKELFTARSDPKLVERVASDMAAGPPEVAVSAMKDAVRYDLGAALAAVKAPIRLINADHWPTNLEAARRCQPAVGLAVMPGVGHFLMAEDPEEFNRLLGRAVGDWTAPMKGQV